MMKITEVKAIGGKEAFELIENADAIILDNNALMYPSFDEEGGEYTLNLSYTDEDGLGYDYEFRWTDEDIISVVDNKLVLKDTDGKESEIQILEIKNI